MNAILEDENNPGIERYNDMTGEKPLIKIYLSKKGNPDRVLKYLYKNTSLQSWYSINMTMLDKGRYPRVFTWREALQAHIDHEKEVYRRGFEFDVNKMKKRIHILEGLLTCLASIDEVVATIKSSKTTSIAKEKLCSKFLLDEEQAKAVLDLKLSRLAHLEVEKLQNEKDDLSKKVDHLEMILNNEELFNNELIKGWQDIIEKFGDERRTRVLNIAEDDDAEPTEIRSLQISLTNKNNVYLSETSTLYTQRRGGVGNKLKMDKDEYVLCTRGIESNEEILFFTQFGDFYHYSAAALPVNEKVAVESLFGISEKERIKAITSLNKRNMNSNIVFITKKGYIKKSLTSEYNLKRSGSLKALTLESGDEIVNILFLEEENVGIMTKLGNFVIISTKDIRPIGRVTRGIHAIKLNEEDSVVDAQIIPKGTKTIVSASEKGLCKQTDIAEFSVQGKNTKGSKIQRLIADDNMISFVPIVDQTEVLFVSNKTSLKTKLDEIPTLSRGAQGTKAIKLTDGSLIIGISQN